MWKLDERHGIFKVINALGRVRYTMWYDGVQDPRFEIREDQIEKVKRTHKTIITF